jgi:hypothetical protein
MTYIVVVVVVDIIIIARIIVFYRTYSIAGPCITPIHRYNHNIVITSYTQIAVLWFVCDDFNLSQRSRAVSDNERSELFSMFRIHCIIILEIAPLKTIIVFSA